MSVEEPVTDDTELLQWSQGPRRTGHADRAAAHRPLFVLEYRLLAPPPTVWDGLTLPELRAQYEPTASAVVGDTAGDAGAVQFRCDHGAFEALESVRAWRPYESYIRDTVTRPLGIPLRSTWRLTDEGGATGLVITVTSPPTAGWFARVAGRFAAPTVRRGIERAMAALGEV